MIKFMYGTSHGPIMNALPQLPVFSLVANTRLPSHDKSTHISFGFLLEWILQNMVRHFVTHKQVQADKLHSIIFRQRITAGSATDL